MRLLLVQPRLSMAPDARNVESVGQLLLDSGVTPARDDVALLPEHVSMATTRGAYVAEIAALARRLGCHVVGGSHHEQRGDVVVNCGLVVDPDGHSLGRYEKLRPYAAERAVVTPGSHMGELSIGGRRVLVLVCADFWFADVFARARVLPDLVLVPALSVTRKATPDYSRALWRHLAVARAYEFGCYVGISDWAHVPYPLALSASGVGGFSDPTSVAPERMFVPIGDAGVAAVEIDFSALEAFRRDRAVRGFFWKAVEPDQ